MYTLQDINPSFRAALDQFARRFLNGGPQNDTDASPVFADVRSLPPILIQMGENESMMSDAVCLARNLSHNRVQTTLEVWPGDHALGSAPFDRIGGIGARRCIALRDISA